MVPILVILTIAICLLVDLAVKARKAPTQAGFAVPGGLFFHRGHAWAHLQTSGEARVGMDDFAQHVIGRIDRIELPTLRARIRQGEKAFTIIQDQKRIDFVSPIDGVVSAVNDAVSPATLLLEKVEYLRQCPGAIENYCQPKIDVVKQDPYQAGWLFAIQPQNLVSNLKKLRIGEEAAAWIEKETRRLIEFLGLQFSRQQEIGITLPDGGQVVAGAVERMDGETLQLLVKRFLR